MRPARPPGHEDVHDALVGDGPKVQELHHCLHKRRPLSRGHLPYVGKGGDPSQSQPWQWAKGKRKLVREWCGNVDTGAFLDDTRWVGEGSSLWRSKTSQAVKKLLVVQPL